MSSYAWVITTNHLDNIKAGPGKAIVSGPRGATEDQLALALSSGFPFIMKDDDGETYYTGKCWTADTEFGSEELFGPLDDYGTPNAGATEILYRKENGRAGAYESL